MTTTDTHPDTRAETPSASTTVRINPAPWAQGYGYDQGQLRTGVTSILTIAGQGPVGDDGRLLHADDVAAQLALSLANVATVVEGAGLQMTDLAQLRIYTTDIDAVLAAYDTVVDHLGSLGATPPATLVEVSRLAVPGMVVEIDGLAFG